MFRRKSWLLPALILTFALRSSATTQHAAVEGIDVSDVIVKPVKVNKAGAEAVDSADVIVKQVKMTKMPVGKVTADSVDVRELKVQRIILEGLEDVKKKVTEDDEESVDKAAKKAEHEQGAAGSDEGSRMQTETRAETEASISATQDALNRGDSLGQATAVAEAARQRVRDDYGRAADGGSLEAPPKTPAAPAERAVAPGEAGPEILEAPPKESAEGEEGEAGKGGENTEPAVIDVPQAQQ
jgi:hypothetical protein